MLDALLNFLQWPALALSLLGAPRVCSGIQQKVYIGFGLWVISNICWVIWAAHTSNWSLLFMQAYFLRTSYLGRMNNRPGFIAGQS